MYSSFPTFLDCGKWHNVTSLWDHNCRIFYRTHWEQKSRENPFREFLFSVWIEDLRHPWRNCQRLIEPILYSLKVLILNGWQWRIQERGTGLSLIFGPNWGPKGGTKSFFKTALSPLSQGLNDLAPLPPLSEGLDPPLDGAAKERAYPLSCLTTSKIEVLKTVSFSRIQSVSSRLVQDPKTKKSLTITYR